MSFRPVVVALHKPVGYVVSKDDKHNDTIYNFLPPSWKEDFYYVGRLDKDSKGLLLLTNVKELVNEFEHPSRNIFKIYEVEITKPFKTNLRDKFKKGVLITEEGEYVSNTSDEKRKGVQMDFLKMYDIHYFKDSKGRYFLRILLTYGKKRHIRRMLKAFGYKVLALTRIKYGKYELGTLKPKQYKIYPLKIRPGKKNNLI